MNESIINEIDRILNVNGICESKQNDDFLWSLISTTILLNERIYDYNKDVDVYFKGAIEDIIGQYEINQNYFLDENNNKLSTFDVVVSNRDMKSFTMYDENLNEDEFELFKDLYYEELPVEYGPNKLIMTGENLDISKLVNHVRNAFAHSSYEIIDENNIRLYSYNKDGKYDLNIQISNILAIAIIDEINNQALNRYIDYIGFDNVEDKEEFLTEEDTLLLLNEYNCFNKDEKDKFMADNKVGDKYDCYNIVENINNKLEYLAGPALGLDYYIYKKYKNHQLFDDYLYERYGEYKFYSKPLDNFSEDKKNEILFKLLFTSLLNNTFVNGFNNKDLNDIDLSKFHLENETKNKLSDKYANLAKQDDKRFTSILKKIEKIDEKIANGEQKLEENKDQDTKYFRDILPKQIEKERENLKAEKDDFYKIREELYKKLFLLTEIRDNITNNVHNDILNHIRNAIAHGNIIFHDFDLNNVNNTYVVFKDYDPKKNNEISFIGSIALSDLLELVMDNKENVRVR